MNTRNTKCAKCDRPHDDWPGKNGGNLCQMCWEAECSDQGFLVDGRWHCIFHHPVAHTERTPASEVKHSAGHEDCPGCDENEARAVTINTVSSGWWVIGPEDKTYFAKCNGYTLQNAERYAAGLRTELEAK